ncbi:MAG: hypothetical protein JSR73_10065 [Proteobacteria bacterium]|nr:hypothetical protein [Pseudomonadota bacterium]
MDALQGMLASIRGSIQTRNWYTALALTLAMPDICAALESSDGKTNGNRYIAWWNTWMGPHYRDRPNFPVPNHVFLGGNDAYALRCAMLHEGSENISTQRKREVLDKFHFRVDGFHCIRVNRILQLSVPTYCEQTCGVVQQWLESFRANEPESDARLRNMLTIHEGSSSPMPGVVFGGPS